MNRSRVLGAFVCLTFAGQVFVPRTLLETEPSRGTQESALCRGKQRRSPDTRYKRKFRKGTGEEK